MSSNLAGYNEQFFQRASSLMPISNFIDILQEKLFYQYASSQSMFLLKIPYLREIYITMLACFAKQNWSTIEDYFSHKMELSALARQLSQFFFDNNIDIDKKKVLEGIHYGDQLVELEVRKRLDKLLTAKNSLNILGFGGGAGYYEKNVADYLIEKRYCKEAKIFIYDPFNKEIGEGTYNLDENITEREQNINFDLIFCRFALHHVEPSCRWSSLCRLVNKLNEFGLLLILEEGDFLQEVHSLPQMFYRFSLMTIDLIINIGLRPEWFYSSYPAIGEKFYLNYLTSSELSNIENNFNFKFKKFSYVIGDEFLFPLTLWVYKKINNKA